MTYCGETTIRFWKKNVTVSGIDKHNATNNKGPKLCQIPLRIESLPVRAEDGSEVRVAGHLQLVPHQPQLFLPLLDDGLLLGVVPKRGSVGLSIGICAKVNKW